MANADLMLDTWVTCLDGSVYCVMVIFILAFPDTTGCFLGMDNEDVIRVILPDVTCVEFNNRIETIINGHNIENYYKSSHFRNYSILTSNS